MSDDRSGSVNTVESIMAQDYKQPMNTAYMTVAQYLIYGLIFGIWYYKVFCKTDNPDVAGNSSSILSGIVLTLKELLRSGKLFLLVIAGYAGQLMVDGILALVRPIFASAFAEYDKLVSNVVGVTSSGAMLLAVLVLAPIAEEILFRGLILGYLRSSMYAPLAILLQGLLFGVYHGNMIQGIYAFVLGSVLGLIAYRFDSVIPGIIFHMALNISIMLVPATWLETTAACIIAAAIGLIILVVMLIVTLKNKNNEASEDIQNF